MGVRCVAGSAAVEELRVESKAKPTLSGRGDELDRLCVLKAETLVFDASVPRTREKADSEERELAHDALRRVDRPRA